MIAGHVPAVRVSPGQPASLGRAQGDGTVVLLELPGDDRGAGVEIDVALPQPGGFTAPQAAQRDQVVGGIQPVALNGIQERGGLRWCPHRDGRADPGALRTHRRTSITSENVLSAPTMRLSGLEAFRLLVAWLDPT
jgi:hypothetical protein